jgi:hypothetical protein
MVETPDVTRCSVCGEDVTFVMSVECNWCGNRYHLNQRNDVEGKDCGQVWIDEQFLALQFACNRCLADDGVAASGAGVRAAQSTVPAQLTAPAKRRRYRRIK